MAYYFEAVKNKKCVRKFCHFLVLFIYLKLATEYVYSLIVRRYALVYLSIRQVFILSWANTEETTKQINKQILP